MVRIGIIGFGNIGSAHAKCVYNNRVENLKLTAICDTNPKRLEVAKSLYPDVSLFSSHEDLLKSGKTDMVLIATPHYFHCPIAIDAFKANQHVLSEKPAGVYTEQIEAMNKAAKLSGKQFGVMFNQRTNPLFAKAREIVQSGELGEFKRMVWIITNWYRSQHYYDSGSWRATWSGEGGGVLLNQAPHQLDLWQWICGMPSKVRGFCSVGKYHNIEVEDDATIYAEYDNGAVATFITSTGEYPGTNRLEISGDQGKIVLENKTLSFWKINEPEKATRFTTSENSPQYETEFTEIIQQEQEKNHQGILEDFANSIVNGTPLLAPGIDGIKEVSISNAAYLSSWKDKWVSLPIDSKEYKDELFKRISTSKGDHEPVKNENKTHEYSSRWNVNW